jgi:hypothetical protein
MWYELRPQRRHKVCVLLWRLPKDEVPLVIALAVQERIPRNEELNETRINFTEIKLLPEIILDFMS